MNQNINMKNYSLLNMKNNININIKKEKEEGEEQIYNNLDLIDKYIDRIMTNVNYPIYGINEEEITFNDEKKYHLNYPTKIKNFICNDYYRPFLKPDMKFFNRDLIKISHNYIPQKIIEKIRREDRLSKIQFIKFLPINEKEKDLRKFLCENVSYKGSIFGKIYILDSFYFLENLF